MVWIHLNPLYPHNIQPIQTIESVQFIWMALANALNQSEPFEWFPFAECSDYWNHSGVHMLNYSIAKTPDTPCDIDLWRDGKVKLQREAGIRSLALTVSVTPKSGIANIDDGKGRERAARHPRGPISLWTLRWNIISITLEPLQAGSAVIHEASRMLIWRANPSVNLSKWFARRWKHLAFWQMML